MQNNTNINLTNSEEDLSDKEETGIITNVDEFCSLNDLQISTSKSNITRPNIISHLTYQNQPKKLNEPYKISSPLENIDTHPMSLYALLLNGEGGYNTIQNKKTLKKKLNKKLKNFNNSNIKKYLDVSKKKGKSVFIKISEDIYRKFKSKPNKEVRDINKTEEDAYNKMTTDNYIKACENKENIKNKKIVQQCLDRKAKEDIFKKIGIECDRNREKKKLNDPKRAFSVTDRSNNLKSTRTLAQFLRDQKGERKKEKKIKNNKKIPLPIKSNILPQDSTFIFSKNKEANFDLSSQFSKISGDYIEYEDDYKSVIPKNDKYLINNEEEKTFINHNINNNINKTFQIDKCNINDNDFSLISDINNNNKKKLIINSNKIKRKKILIGQDKNILSKKKIASINNNSIKDTSITKDNTENMIKKYIDIYKETIELCLNKKIENDFDINYMGFLSLLFKLGFTNKNYSFLMEMSYDLDSKKVGTIRSSQISDISISNSSIISMKQKKDNIKNNNNVNKNSIGGKSLEDEGERYINNFKIEKEFQISKDAWKILTEKSNFDEKISISSRIFFLFYISVLGIGGYLQNGKKFSKKEFNFFFGDKKLMAKYNNMNKYINKYFGIYASNAQDNALISEKNTLLMKSNYNSLVSSFSVNNSDISDNKYDIYKKNYKNYQNNINNNLIEDTNSVRLFKEEINKEGQIYFNVLAQSEKSIKSFMSLTDINHIESNSNLLNNSMTDSSSILDLKKILTPSDNLRNDLDGDKEGDELELDSFLFENTDNNNINKNDTQYKKNIKEEEKESKKKNSPKNNDNSHNPKKRVGYVFEIKVNNEMKKLILKKGENKNIIVQNFCKKYNIKEKEKVKILKIIEERLNNLNN